MSNKDSKTNKNNTAKSVQSMPYSTAVKINRCKEMIIQAVNDSLRGNNHFINNVSKALYKAEEAKQVLRNKGYGWAGLDILQTAKEVISWNTEPDE